MKRIIFLVFITIIMTGCSANYDIVFEDNTFKESLNVIFDKNSEQDQSDFVNQYYNNSIILVNYKDQPGDMSKDEILKNYKYYNKVLISEQDKYGINLNYTFRESEEYKNSFLVNNLFRNFTVTNENIIASNVSNIFDSYPYLEEIKVSFKSDKKVYQTNADKEDNGIYYWYINRDNYNNKLVSIQFKNKKSSNPINIQKGKFDNFINFVVLIILIIVLVSIAIIYDKVKKSNK